MKKNKLILICFNIFLVFCFFKANYTILKFFILSTIFFIFLSLIPLKNKDLKLKIWLIVISSYFSIAIFEIFLRFNHKSNVLINNIGKRPVIRSRLYHHDYRPSQQFYLKPSKEDEFTIISNIINEFGIRTGENFEGYSSDKEKIILLGDSFIQADEIEFESVVGQILQKKIDKDLNLNYEIIQHGMSSWSPVLELNWLIKKGLSFKPKSVVLFLCINDFYQDYFSSDLAYTKETVFDLDGYPKEFNISVYSDKYLLYSNLGRCYFYDFFIKQYHLFIKNQRKPKSGLSNLDIYNILSVKSKDFPKYFAENYANVEQYNHHIKNILELTRPVELWDKDLVENINISLDYIDKINSILKNNGSELIVALTPLPWNINLKENYKGRKNYLFENIVLPMGGIEKKIVEFCKSNKIEYLDIYKNFKTNGIENKFIFLVSDGHWSEFGHKLVGSLLYDFYKNRFKE